MWRTPRQWKCYVQSNSESHAVIYSLNSQPPLKFKPEKMENGNCILSLKFWILPFPPVSPSLGNQRIKESVHWMIHCLMGGSFESLYHVLHCTAMYLQVSTVASSYSSIEWVPGPTQSGPIRGQYLSHENTIDQSEAKLHTIRTTQSPDTYSHPVLATYSCSFKNVEIKKNAVRYDDIYLCDSV